MTSKLVVFEDRSGMAVLREDLNTVVVYASSIQASHPALYLLLTSPNSSLSQIEQEACNNGLFAVEYKY